MPSLLGDLTDRVANRVVRHVPGPTVDIALDTPIVTFSFDDVPMSAATEGARILEAHGARGTYYVSGSLVGTVEPDRALISRDACAALAARGHELACHTFSHSKLRQLSSRQLAEDLDRNQAFLSAIDGNAGRRNFATPFTKSWPPAMATLRRRFLSARGGVPGVNRARTDLADLKAVEIRQTAFRDGAALPWIDEVAARPGWLILFAHDIADDPTPYGCTPATLESLVARADGLGCRILTVMEALTALGLPSR